MHAAIARDLLPKHAGLLKFLESIIPVAFGFQQPENMKTHKVLQASRF